METQRYQNCSLAAVKRANCTGGELWEMFEEGCALLIGASWEPANPATGALSAPPAEGSQRRYCTFLKIGRVRCCWPAV